MSSARSVLAPCNDLFFGLHFQATEDETEEVRFTHGSIVLIHDMLTTPWRPSDVAQYALGGCAERAVDIVPTCFVSGARHAHTSPTNLANCV